MACRSALMGLVAAAFSLVLLAPPAAQAAGNAERGRKLAYTCAGCHGIEFYKNAYPNYNVPRLGGQHSNYIVAALNEYKARSRWHPTMQGQAGAISAQDMQDIAAWYEGPEPIKPGGKPLGTPPAAAAVCVACHGQDGVGITPDYPVIAGQHRDYIAQALNDYRRGRRQNPIMGPFAQQLKPQDIAVLAEFFSKQKGVYTRTQR